LFWLGNGSGSSIDGVYSNWDPSNPNDSGGQDYAKIFAATGLWDDVDGTVNQKFIVEFDADSVLDATNALTYSIQSQTVAGAFTINSDTGEITVADGSLLDYETNATHTVTVRVSDGTATYDEAFTVSLNDLAESDNAPTNLSSGIELNTDGGNDAYLVDRTSGVPYWDGFEGITMEFQVSDLQTPTSMSTFYSKKAVASESWFAVHADGTLEWTSFATSGQYSQLFDGGLHSVAFSWDAPQGDLRFYIDGRLVETVATPSQSQTNGGGVFVLGQEQDSVEGNFDPAQSFAGTFHDVRIWNQVRSEVEIALNYQNKFDSGSLPSGLVANWQMDGFNGSNQVVDVVSGNNLSIGHATGAGFIASTPVEDLHISETATDGTSVGFVVPSGPDAPQDIVSDGQFLKGDTGSWTNYTQGQTIGDWTVESGVVSHTSTYVSPGGGVGLELQAGAGQFPASITQTLVTEVGRQYQLVFNMSGNFGGGQPVKHLVASAAGQSMDFQVTDTFGTGLGYEPRSMTFTADDTSTVLRFAAGVDDAWAAIITDVRVIEIPAAVTAILHSDLTLSYDAATGKFYRQVTSPDTFFNAQAIAESSLIGGVGGRLVTIGSASENSYVHDFARSVGANVWIGASDATIEGDWRWLDPQGIGEQFWSGDAAGSAVAGRYANWVATEPNDAAGVQDHAKLRSADGLWTDVDGGATTSAYIIEWDASEVLSNFTFSLTDDAGGRFAIDSNSGEITVADSSQLDYETNTSHNVTVQVTDAAGNSYSEVMTIAVDNGLELTHSLPGAQSVDEDSPLVFSTANGNAITVSDTMAATNTRLQVFISTNNNGTLTLSQTTGLSILGGSNGGTFMTIQGTESDLNAAFEGMAFTPAANYSGPVTLDMTTSLGADLQGYYTFEGGNAIDQSVGISQNGTLVGNATTVNDPERGEVLSLDGVDDYVSISGRFSDPTNVTLAAWVYVDSADTNGSHVLSLGNSVVLGVDRPNGGEGVQGFFYDGSTYQATTSGIFIADTGWQHIAYVFDDANDLQTLYINGTAVAENRLTAGISYTLGANSRIGGNATGTTTFDFDGLIDDARVYTRALSADEIAALANGQTSVTGNVAITVNAVNDTPVLSLGIGGGTYYENAAGVYIDTLATVTDADGVDFDGGVLTTWVSNNGTVDDQLFVRHEGTGAGQVNISGSD
ncbi:MAG: cadherin domain-containing protein, partial [Planctomycetaceae bacterium]|nr:cadherin domain-containing protein [Planctomycetaceae bacterium]